ncbi:hypothetical protein BDW22DRAFT_1433552 [Trametopsis cervina]|nr:hypothetical protein BDW22DRAFT_1433552 [Trametopsis cervina]
MSPPQQSFVLPKPTVFWSHRNNNPVGLYSSPTATFMVDDCDWGDLNIFSALHPRWVSDTDFWTALVPRNIVWEGLLAPLAYANIIKVDVENGVRWRLGNAAGWQCVELTLANIKAAMIKLGILLPLDFKATPWPRTFNYATEFFLKNDARKAVARARAAFLAVIGRLTYYGILLQHKNSSPWLDRISEQSLLPSDLIDDLQASVICQCAYRISGLCRRTGLFLDARDPVSAEMEAVLMVMMEEFAVPVYLWYGPIPRLVQPFAQRYLPSRERVDACRKLDTHQMFSTLVGDVPLLEQSVGKGRQEEGSQSMVMDAEAGAASPSSMPTESRPVNIQRDPITRYIPGQTFEEFVQAEEIFAERRKAQETPRQRQARLSRETAYADKPPPGRRGAKVFIWEYDAHDCYIQFIS